MWPTHHARRHSLSRTGQGCLARRAHPSIAPPPVVFALLNVRRELPLNVRVTAEFTPEKAGDIAFARGMTMRQRGPRRITTPLPLGSAVAVS
jgi:plastocyanin domain-containing protein